MTSKYFMEAFLVGKEKAIMRREYKTSIGLARAVRLAADDMKADFLMIRRIEK